MAATVPLRVCVVGAGAAGLCSARHLLTPRLADGTNAFSFTIFEQAATLGGIWNYTDDTSKSRANEMPPVHSSMYQNLRTNLPKEIMAFPDFSFPKEGPSFIHHSLVKEYLKNYADHFGLRDYIRFNSIVTSIQPKICDLPKSPWEITVKDLTSFEEQTFEFDSVMICNGHYCTPRVPVIPGIEKFFGSTLHSHDYRESSSYVGQTVIILGASASGLDLAVEISACAKKVYLSHNLPEPIQCELPLNVTEVPGIQAFDNEGFLLENNTVIQGDALLYCTGYEYSFPFLDPKCQIKIEDNRVMDLYKHMINIKYPTMCFIGLPFIVVPFVVFHFQVLFFLRSLQCASLLPCSAEAMAADTLKDFEARQALKMPWKYAHKFGSLQWKYIAELTALSEAEKLPPVIQKIYEHVSAIRKKQLLKYRTLNYVIVSSDHFTSNQIN